MSKALKLAKINHHMVEKKEVKNIDAKSEVALNEERVLAFWKDQKIFEQSLKKNEGQKEYVFYDGPPFATGLPHYGHILGSTTKDIVPRYQTMRGRYVTRKWGWDCHGLPIENIVEKDLKISGKVEIEALGIDKFNEHARSKVLEYIYEWERTVDRIGRWVDFKGSYKTMDNTYIESVWWALKELGDKDLIYEGTKVLPYCPRCETPIANSEIAMDNSYKDITDISVYVKFELVDDPGTYLVAWTTTPWTLPGNTAAAINPGLTYSKVSIIGSKKSGDGKLPEGKYILAKDRLEVALRDFDYKVEGEMSGEELVGKAYIPVFDYYKDKNIKNKENGWKVYAGTFVTADSGTGIVHIAPGFGEDDMVLAKEYNLPLVLHVGTDGKFKPDVKDFAGKMVKPKPTKEEPQLHQSSDIEIIKYLAHNNKLFSKEKIVHSYPHCFRCETPLFYYAIPAWFIKITDVKQKLLKEAEKIHWVPEHLKEGRFKNIVEGAPDWNISRNRFWASPLPIWKCATCERVEFLGGVEDIKQKTKSKNTYVVMRHGEAQNNIQNVVNSDLKENTFALSKEGEDQVKKTISNLKEKHFDFVFVSPFLRTKQTAQLVTAALGIPEENVVVDDRLGEINTGVYDGKSIDEYHSYSLTHPDRFVEGPQNGECYNEVKKRMMDFLYEIDSKYEGKNILIVTHDTPGWLLLAGVHGKNAYEALEFRGTGKFFFANAEMRELEFSKLPHNAKYELDLHRPYIDSITWKCECGNGEMKRIPEVIDCWFESGSMPFAQVHYPFQNKEWFKENFPAQFISEYIAQTRTWFYYTHAVGTMLFGHNAFENVVTTGTVLAEDGQKMSKSKGNFPDPWLVMNKYGVDALRYYLMSSPVMKSEDLRFSEKGVDEVYKKVVLRLNNVVSFYEMYASEKGEASSKSKNILDQWIISRLNEVIDQVTENMESYHLNDAVEPFDLFVDDLSTWYLRRSRDRFKGDDEADRNAALQTLRYVILELSKTMAPFTPFLAETMFAKVKEDKDPVSVHLCSWPKSGSIDLELHEAMKQVRNLVSFALEARSKCAIKVRQPLQKLSVKTPVAKELIQLIKDEVNVKEVVVDENITDAVLLDTNITPELKLEGAYRELLRSVQELRKKENLVPNDRVSLIIETSESGKDLIEKFKSDLMKVAGLKDVVYGTVEGEGLKIDEFTFKVKIEK